MKKEEEEIPLQDPKKIVEGKSTDYNFKGKEEGGERAATRDASRLSQPATADSGGSSCSWWTMDRRYLYILLPLILSTGCVYLISRSSNSGRAAPTLVRAFVAFRHGSRAPLMTYANDQYGIKNSKIWPEGPDNLTKKGKMEAYKLGKRLRDRYHHFLGSLYKEEEFRAYTTLIERTMMTGQIVLSALFPPVGYQKWNEDLDWQPIPIYPEYIFNSSVGGGCPKFRMESISNMFRGGTAAGGEKVKETLAVIMKHAGEPNRRPYEVFARVWDSVYMQAREDLPIPEWLKKVYPDKLSHTALFLLSTFIMGSETQRKLVLHNYAMALMTYLLAEEARKMEIHSWHDLNQLALLGTLGIEVDTFPEPTSTIIVELHQASWGKFFEVYSYDSWKSEEPRQLKMPCGLSCPLEELNRLVNKYQVDNYTELCRGGPLNSTLPPLHEKIKKIFV